MPARAPRTPAPRRIASLLGAGVVAVAAAVLAPLGQQAAQASPGGTIVGVEAGVGIFSMRADGGGLQMIVADPAARAVAGAPGSDRIAYGDIGSSQVTIATGSGKTLELVSVPGLTGSVTSVAWSPDGQQVAFSVCQLVTSSSADSCVVDVAQPATGSEVITPAPAGVDPDSGLSWGGSGLVMAGSFSGQSACPGCSAGFFLVDPAGQQSPVPTAVGGLDSSSIHYGSPAVAADGSLAWSATSGSSGRQTQVLTPSGAHYLYAGSSSPAWSPDGSALVMTNGYQVLEATPATGGSPQRIASLPAYGVTSLSWFLGSGASPGCSVALAPGAVQAIAGTPDGQGYWITDAYGSVSACGSAADFGGLGGQHLNQPVLSIAAMPKGNGYRLASYDGGVFSFGAAPSEPLAGAGTPAPVSLAGTALPAPIWAMASTADGQGFWLASTAGGVYTFGNAPYFGSAAPLHLNRPLVGMAATPDGKGYWLAFSDGAVLGFGDTGVPFLGLSSPPSAPIVGIATDPVVHDGLWLLGADGVVYPLGGAPALGSDHPTAGGARAIAPTPDGGGYWVVDANGLVTPFGSAAPHGNAA